MDENWGGVGGGLEGWRGGSKGKAEKNGAKNVVREKRSTAQHTNRTYGVAGVLQKNPAKPYGARLSVGPPCVYIFALALAGSRQQQGLAPVYFSTLTRERLGFQ